jgi:hypothetical protein
MLHLFQFIFGAGPDAAAPYPEELIDRAIERAVNGTDPRLRALPGYGKKLHDAAGLRIVARPVSIERAALPPPRDWLREAQRYLG